jgi:aryl sulfotransferase
MQADTAAVLRRALEFAGRLAGEAEIARAVKFADFAQLRQQEQDKGFREAPRPHAGGEFFRRGAAGGWREEDAGAGGAHRSRPRGDDAPIGL